MAFAKKTWKDRIAEFPTRRRLTKEDNTSELVTVAREEGTLSQEGDAFSAENMNDLESRIDVEFTELNGKLNLLQHYKVINGSNTGKTLTFTLSGVTGWSSRMWLVINFDCRSTYSVDLTGIYLVKYYANTANIGTVTIEKISGKVPNCAIIDNQIVLTYMADQTILGSNKIICIGC